MKKLTIAIDCDDAAVDLKQVVYDHLAGTGWDITDLNYSGDRAALYPEIGYNLAVRMQQKDFDRGILICGTGIGMSIIANKVEGVYAGLCHDTYSAERLQKSNNAQVLTMGARVIGSELAKSIVDAWLVSEFQGGGSLPKVEQMSELERQSFSKRKTD